MTDKNSTSSPNLRLPGSVAEVRASPRGPKVGAFFDLDGTLVAGFTAVILTRERFKSRDMGVGELISMIAAGLNHQLGLMEFEDLIGKATEALRGRSLSDLQQIGERLFAEKIEKRIYPEMRDLVDAHMARGHTVVLSSSALTIQVDPVARYLGIPNTLTNQFEVDDDGVLTGKVEKLLAADAKQDAVCDLCTDDLKDKPLIGLPVVRGVKQDAEDKTIWGGGTITDAKEGKVYKVRLKPIEGGNKLEVRGYIGMPMLGRTQTWIRVE